MVVYSSSVVVYVFFPFNMKTSFESNKEILRVFHPNILYTVGWTFNIYIQIFCMWVASCFNLTNDTNSHCYVDQICRKEEQGATANRRSTKTAAISIFPCDKDILISFATTSGRVAYSANNLGAPYIEKLTKVQLHIFEDLHCCNNTLCYYACCLNLLSLLTCHQTLPWQTWLANQHTQIGHTTLLTSNSSEHCFLSSKNKFSGLTEQFVVNHVHHVS